MKEIITHTVQDEAGKEFITNTVQDEDGREMSVTVTMPSDDAFKALAEEG